MGGGGWILCAAAAVSLVLFAVVRLCILRRENSLKHGFRALPFFYGLTIAFLAYFFVYKASPGLGTPPWARVLSRVFSSSSPLALLLRCCGSWPPACRVRGAGWDKQYTPAVILGVCGAFGFGTLFVVWLLGVPLLWQWIDNKYDEQGERRRHYGSGSSTFKSMHTAIRLPPPTHSLLQLLTNQR
jgi:hypothetical protein